jgi:glycosyltransferase involved in cell wall biosynthesis
MKVLLEAHGVPEDRIRVIHNAIEPWETKGGYSREETRRRHGLAEDHRVIGVVGRLSPEKGQRIFLKAMKKVVHSVPNARALIVGDGQDRETLERVCEVEGLQRHVIFVGHQERIADYYRAIDLLVLPSLSEGLPNTVLEAMNFGIPVVATSVGGVPEIIRDGNGVVVPPNDAIALGRRIIDLIGDRELSRAIGLRGKESLYPRFDAGARAQRIVRLYEEVLSD